MYQTREHSYSIQRNVWYGLNLQNSLVLIFTVGNQQFKKMFPMRFSLLK